MNARVCVYAREPRVVKGLWSCNVIRGWIEKDGSPTVLEWLG